MHHPLKATKYKQEQIQNKTINPSNNRHNKVDAISKMSETFFLYVTQVLNAVD